MTISQAVIMGFVQGLTEFLPISSSGHLVIMHHLLGFEEPPITFDVLVHLSTTAAVILAFWGDVRSILSNPRQKLVLLIVVASIPTAIIGFLFEPIFKGFFTSLMVVGGGLLLTGVLLWVSDRMTVSRKGLGETSYFDALIIGAIQGLAITPGVSRSGSTIAGGLLLGLNRDLAARFSFLLSVPAVLGAGLLEFKDIYSGGSDLPFWPALTGALSAGLTSFLAILFLLRLVRQGRLHLFAYYCWAVGLLVLFSQLS
ncbi:MAG: undecaprenyl-diphosphate phosphatase [Syntrophomonadaceae bacterium]|nr:undecaprenyl-diphosphate phosphatase [Syntrophomonadaceae bacterium]